MSSEKEEDWIYRHRIMRRGVLIWTCVIINYTIFAYLENIGKVQNADAVIVPAIIGILAWVLKYQEKERRDR